MDTLGQIKIIGVAVLFLMSSCRSYNRFVEHRVDKILNKYGKLEVSRDTIINENHTIREYKKGDLYKIGHVRRDGSKKGKWYTFENNLSLYYLVKYRHNKADTILKPVRIVNKSDW